MISSPFETPVWPIATAAATVSSRFFGLIADRATPSAAARAGVKWSTAFIQPAPALPRRGGPAAPLPRREEHDDDAEHQLDGAGRVRRLAVADAGAAGDEDHDHADDVRPASQPARKAGPLVRARALESIRMTPTIGIGLIDTTTAKAMTCPIASPRRPPTPRRGVAVNASKSVSAWSA